MYIKLSRTSIMFKAPLVTESAMSVGGIGMSLAVFTQNSSPPKKFVLVASFIIFARQICQSYSINPIRWNQEKSKSSVFLERCPPMPEK